MYKQRNVLFYIGNLLLKTSPSRLRRATSPIEGRPWHTGKFPSSPMEGHYYSDAFSNASPTAFCKASMEMVQRAARSGSEPSAGMDAASASVLPLR